MDIERIKSRLNLLNKIIFAFKEAEASGIKNPEKLLKRALKEKAKLKAEKPSLKKA